MNYKRDIREICFGFHDRMKEVKTVSENYLLLYDVINIVKNEMRLRHPGILKREWMEEVAKIFGVTSQTLYRARAAVRSFKYPEHQPSKYARYSYNKLKKQLGN